ncbi:IS4 family transposase [Promicromonospora iranensis]|uniref:IS4 family transposase n=1 Tax=Promicromonospora iranensis TaxID=1105144 RepID=A0ABU2CIQ1_9MICO|nr:IS4 family transposase [Promicromonospora iranensis]MDR7381193.1 hypothetical protein [Promicromonospora iranensis]
MSDPVINVRALSAPGVFAPGHLGELTVQVPPEVVDTVLAETGRVEQRARLLPGRVVVYLLLAGALFEDMGWRQVWARLVQALPGQVAAPSSPAISQALRRVGIAPLAALFDLLRGPAATTANVSWRGLLVCAIDGTQVSVPAGAANETVFSRQPTLLGGGGGYPAVRIVALIACGTRSLIDALFGPTTTGEVAMAPGLARSLRPGMLVLGDRNFCARNVVAALAATGAQLLFRSKTAATAARLRRVLDYADGTWLAWHGPTLVRVLDASITVTLPDGTTRTESYRLITTLLDPAQAPAAALVRLYHQRWQIETAYCELKSTILGGRVLRAKTPAGVTQEIYALLTCYQLLRTAMTDATNTNQDLAPDRASFTIALLAARDQIVTARHCLNEPDLIGLIGAAVLADLLPAPRPRTRQRIRKRAISKYNARGPAIDHKTYPIRVTLMIERATLTPTSTP